jgi:diadenosine tetraphosphatase ApaH/serine/threonine PP2A family protein phosphatase
LFGGIYNNYLALQQAVDDAKLRGVDGIYCLGDLGAFGPHPNRVFPILRDNGVTVIRGNYDDSVGRGLEHCQCGYTDPRDNHFASLSYRYTFDNTDASHRPFLANLPTLLDIRVDDHRVRLCHGSPRRTNEFLWESTTSTQFLDKLLDDAGVDAMAVTHTGIKWRRALRDGRAFVNVGVLGRPENDGTTNVWYAILESDGSRLRTEFIPVVYDYQRLAGEMRSEGLPEKFAETILTGYWTTCLEILPAKERARGIH